MKMFRIYAKNRNGEHTLFLNLSSTFQTAKKYYLDAVLKGWDPVILVQEDMYNSEFKIRYQFDGEWKTTKPFDLLIEDLKYMVYYHSAHLQDYVNSCSKSFDEFGHGESIPDWIFNHSNQEKFVLWLFDHGYLE